MHFFPKFWIKLGAGKMWGGRKKFSSALLGSLDGSENQTDRDRSTAEKHTSSTEFLHVQGAFTRERRLEEVNRAGSCYSF